METDDKIRLPRSALWRIARYTPIGAVQLLESNLLGYAEMCHLAEYLRESEWTIVQHVLPRLALGHPQAIVREGAFNALCGFARDHGWAKRAIEVMAEKDASAELRQAAREELDEVRE